MITILIHAFINSSKLSFLEFRTQENRGSQLDTGRDLTNYLVSCCDQSLEYLQVGVERRAKSWFGTRKNLKDLDSSEFEATWTKLKEEAFEHAFANLEETKKTAEVGTTSTKTEVQISSRAHNCSRGPVTNSITATDSTRNDGNLHT